MAEGILGGERAAIDIDDATLERAVMTARILDYAQGFRILEAAAEEFNWSLDYARIAEIWRAGCIIRSALLNDISDAFRGELPAGQLILAPQFAKILTAGMPALRDVVAKAISAGYAVPSMASAVAFYDSLRQGRGTANIIQSQRDFFGYHGFERVGEEGAHHGSWWDA